MGRPGPLQDLPLERFLLPDTNVPNTPSKHLRSTKRPLSPGTPVLYSPAKRRILNEEGIFSPKRTPRSPASSSSRGRFAPEYFDALLKGPDSPAKKLDFGTPKSATPSFLASAPSTQSTRSTSVDRDDRDDITSTPRRFALSARKLAPSPELVSKHGNLSSRMSRTSSMMDEDDTDSDYFRPDSRSSSSHTPTSLLSPRDDTPPDRQSIHYPGFDVFRDAFDASDTRSELPTVDADYLMDDQATEHKLVTETPKREKDEEKENMRPKRKAHKIPSAPADAAWAKAGLLSPQAKQREMERSGRAKTIPVSPSVKRIYEIREGSITPKSRTLSPLDSIPVSLSSRTLNASPCRTPLSEQERRLRRKTMEEEADYFVGEDDDVPF